MLYAIVDIETTGGHPSASGITEIAINVFDGEQIVDQYHSLINPSYYIPTYITALTGISNEMVEDAPSFSTVAPEIAKILQGKVFVAHNVNFDYSFLKHFLLLEGFELSTKRLCTVRMSRKIFPGHPSYSLGKLCNTLSIPIVDRHRAKGDADATTILFDRLLKADDSGHMEAMLKKSSKEQQLPPNVDKAVVENLPSCPGIYYFKNNKGKVIYVGKAVNIKKRVISHFTSHASSKQRQDFLKNTYTIESIPCGTELMALILEVSEIKRLWPDSNSAMKRYEHKYALINFTDQNGYHRLAIDKSNKVNGLGFQSFNNLLDGFNFLQRMVSKFHLCPKLCHLQSAQGACTHFSIEDCYGACMGKETPLDYNIRLDAALKEIKSESPCFAVVDHGRENNEYSCLLVENGRFYGMGYIDAFDQIPNDLENLKEKLKPYHSNNYIVNLIYNYVSRHPQKLHLISVA